MWYEIINIQETARNVNFYTWWAMKLNIGRERERLANTSIVYDDADDQFDESVEKRSFKRNLESLFLWRGFSRLFSNSNCLHKTARSCINPIMLNLSKFFTNRVTLTMVEVQLYIKSMYFWSKQRMNHIVPKDVLSSIPFCLIFSSLGI